MDMKVSEAKEYFDGHILALNNMLGAEDPWVFLCASAVIEYLSKLVTGGEGTDGANFKQFVRDYMPEKYKQFKYKENNNELSSEMYHVLRCGLVHSFSLVPDPKKAPTSRKNSIILAHDGVHLSPYNETDAPDACWFRASDFIADISTAKDNLFNKAGVDSISDPKLTDNITKWLKTCPPIKPRTK